MLPRVFRLIATAIRHLGKASIAFRFLADIPVPSPHIETVGIECPGWPCFVADDTTDDRSNFSIDVRGQAFCRASVACRISCDMLVPAPHIETVGIECCGWQCLPAEDTIDFR